VALAPGPAAIFSHRPPGDKVALGEMVRRALSAWSLVEKTLEEGLRGKHPAGPAWSGGWSSHP